MALTRSHPATHEEEPHHNPGQGGGARPAPGDLTTRLRLANRPSGLHALPAAAAAAAPSSSSSGGARARMQRGAAAPPRATKWCDDDEEDRGGRAAGCARFKFSVWLGVVVLLVLTIIGLSVTMAVLQSKRDKSGNGTAGGPPPPTGGDSEDITGGGGGSGGNGFTGALAVQRACWGRGGRGGGGSAGSGPPRPTRPAQASCRCLAPRRSRWLPAGRPFGGTILTAAPSTPASGGMTWATAATSAFGHGARGAPPEAPPAPSAAKSVPSDWLHPMCVQG